MLQQIDLAGSFTLPGTSMTVNRMGYGAMQLAGHEVFGPPRDIDMAIAVLREAVESGVNHIDTSDYYGPHVTNQRCTLPRGSRHRHQSPRAARCGRCYGHRKCIRTNGKQLHRILPAKV